MGDEALSKQVVSHLVESISAVDPGKASARRIRDKLFAKVRAEDTPQPILKTVTESDGVWEETSPGNWVKPLRSDGKTVSILVRLEAGAVFPAHSHPEDEETFVLEGQTQFGDIELTAGDYHFAQKGTEHGAVTTETGCLLFIRTALPNDNG